MKELMAFLMANWQLTAGFVAVLLAIIVLEYRASQSGVSGLLPEALTQMINKEHAVVFDCRDAASFQAGHVTGAIHLNPDELDQQLKQYKKYQSKPCVVVDADGRQFAGFIKRLQAAGFENAFGLRGGIAAWKDAGYPLVKEG